MRAVWVHLLENQPPDAVGLDPAELQAVRQVLEGGEQKTLFFNVQAAAFRAADAPEWVGAETELAAGLFLRRDAKGQSWLVRPQEPLACDVEQIRSEVGRRAGRRCGLCGAHAGGVDPRALGCTCRGAAGARSGEW